MLFYNTEILNLLERRVKKRDLEGYYGGIFSPDKTKFVARTYVRLDPARYEDYSHMYGLGHSAVGMDIERTKVYLDDGCYQSKSLEDCIEEGVYQAYSIRFSGAWWEGKWFILDELMFFGEKMDEAGAKTYLSKYDDIPDYWDIGNFKIDWNVKLPGTDKPIRDVEREEYPGTPFLVSHIKIERKTAINRAYSAYINVSLVDPFLRQLRIDKFEEYVEFSSTPWGQTLLYPESKAFFLMVTLARHWELGWRLVWFFYDTAAARFYRWTYPQPRYTGMSYWYGEEVIEDIKDISGWDDYGFLNTSRTLDNPTFWSEYVLKKIEDRYQWLEEV